MLLLLCARPPLANALEWQFTAEEFEYGEVRLQKLQAGYGPGGRFEVSAARWAGPAEDWLGEGFVLGGTLHQWSAGGASGPFAVAEVQAWGLRGEARWSSHADGSRLVLELPGQALGALRGLPGMPAVFEWLSSGSFDAELSWDDGREDALQARIDVRELGFDSPDGRFAGETLGASLQLAGRAGLDRLVLEGRVDAGELLLDDFYRDFADGGLVWAATAHASGDGWVLAPLKVADDGALAIDATLAWGVAGLGVAPSLQVNRLELDFPVAYHRYIESTASVYALDGLQATGRLLWYGEWMGGRFRSGDLTLSDISLVDVERARFALTGLDARLRPGDHAFDSSLAWRGLMLGRVNLGPGRAEVDSEPGVFALRRPLSLEVMGGRVDIERLRIDLPGSTAAAAVPGDDQPDVLLRARLADLDVERLTEAFGWPAFSGRLSGEIPDVTLDDGVLELDGEIRVEVFDGRLSMSGLRVERPFGVLPSLAADIEVEALDLEQLTHTFEFGRISGRLDGYVRGLRMLDWRPVSFDAWVGTPEDAGRSNAISRQAVNRLTAIGGGGAAAALSNPVLRMFSNFSYRRIGLGCRLRNNVCALRGLSDDGQGVVILEGAGVPKITIRAFNRNLDWPRMVSNLVAVSAGESIVVGGAPPEQ